MKPDNGWTIENAIKNLDFTPAELARLETLDPESQEYLEIVNDTSRMMD